MRIVPLIALAGLLTPFEARSQTHSAHQSGATSGIDALPRDLEMQLALSALPAHLREGATVYVLNPARGFEVARQGSNGFHAFVTRLGDDAFRGTWPLTEYPSDILYPISFDRTGANEQMRVFFDAASMQAAGRPAAEVKRVIQGRFASGRYRAPKRAGVSYMLSPILRTYWNPEANGDIATMNIPHVMYYAPNVSNEDLGGARPPSILPFVTVPGPHGYVIQWLGENERAAIVRENADMLARLCAIKDVWCLREGVPGYRVEKR